MNHRAIFFGILLGVSTASITILSPSPSWACTPHPDYPDGCNGLNGVPLRRQPYPPYPFDRDELIQLRDRSLDGVKVPSLDRVEPLSPTLPLPPPKSK
jgi:hypothetical protein